MRKFDTGAMRDSDDSKFDYEGFLSPLVLRRFAAYMHQHRVLPDGSLRGSDNWQQGMPREVYIKSALRHFLEWWSAHRGYRTDEDIETSLCALLFNVQGYLHELLSEKENAKVDFSQTRCSGDSPGHEGDIPRNTVFSPKKGPCPYCVTDDSERVCGSFLNSNSDQSACVCTRPEGHPGHHIACAMTAGFHNITNVCP